MYEWLSRDRSDGAACLVDQCSVRRSQWQTLDPQHLQRTVALRHKRYTPRTNSKADRIIKTLVHEWGYGLSIQSSNECNRWLTG